MFFNQTVATKRMKRSIDRFQIFATLPVLVVAFCFLLFWKLVEYAVFTNLALNGIILVVMLIGVVIMHFKIYEFRKEWRLLDSFYRRVDSGEEIANVLKDHDIQNSDVGRVLIHISAGPASLGNRSIQAAIEAQLDALDRVLDSRQELAHFLVGFMVALGLLGTFIGILETLIQIGSLLQSFSGVDVTTAKADGLMSTFIADLAKPMRGMGTAFSASMFGLVGSLCLGLTMVAVRRSAVELVDDLRDVVSRTTKIPTFDSPGLSIGADFQFLTGFLADLLGQQRESISMFQQGLETNARNMQKMECVESRLGDLCAAIDKQLSVNAETNALLRDNPASRQNDERYLNEVKVLASAATENSANVSSLLPALSAVTAKLSSFSDLILHQREQIQQTFSSVSESHGLLKASVISSLEREAAYRSAMLEDVEKVHQLLVEMRPAAIGASSVMVEIRGRLNEQLISLNDLQEALRLMTQAIAQSFSGVRGSVADMLVDGQRNRDVQSQALNKIINVQDISSHFNSIQEILKNLAEASANNIAVSRVMLDELRGVKGGILRELRLDMREWELRRDGPPPQRGLERVESNGIE